MLFITYFCKVYEINLINLTSEKAPYILFNHKLGIAFWCIPKLYSHSLDLFRETRKSVYGEGNKDPHLVSFPFLFRCYNIFNKSFFYNSFYKFE